MIIGETGKYYCGMRLLSCGCCDGTCGPNNGCNCLACQALDREEQEQKNEEAARPPPSSYIMDSWTWGPQPGKEVGVISLIVSQY